MLIFLFFLMLIKFVLWDFVFSFVEIVIRFGLNFDGVIWERFYIVDVFIVI